MKYMAGREGLGEGIVLPVDLLYAPTLIYKSLTLGHDHKDEIPDRNGRNLFPPWGGGMLPWR